MRNKFLGLVTLVGLCALVAACAPDNGPTGLRRTKMEYVSLAANGGFTYGGGYAPDISGDGNWIAWTGQTNTGDVVPTTSRLNVYLTNRITHETRAVPEDPSIPTTNEYGYPTGTAPSISDDGTRVAFHSASPWVVPGPANTLDDVIYALTHPRSDVFVHDFHNGTSTRVSVAPDGTLPDGDSEAADISADGRFVAFQSDSTNLVPGDTNGATDVFVADLDTGTVSRVSVASDGGDLAGWASDPSISADGRYVAFVLSNEDPTPGGTPVTSSQVLVHDTDSGDTRQVLISGGPSEADRVSRHPSISADGRLVAFDSWIPNETPWDSGFPVIYVNDHDTGASTLVTKSYTPTIPVLNNEALHPSISPSGRFVAFESSAANILANPAPGGVRSTYLYDRNSGVTKRVSEKAAGGGAATGPSTSPVVASLGTTAYVAFASLDPGLVALPVAAGVDNNMSDVFVATYRW